jgi:hypothetical protein
MEGIAGGDFLSAKGVFLTKIPDGIPMVARESFILFEAELSSRNRDKLFNVIFCPPKIFCIFRKELLFSSLGACEYLSEST